MGSAAHELVHLGRAGVGDKAEASALAALFVLHYHVVQQFAKLGKVALERLVVCLEAEAANKHFPKLLRLQRLLVGLAVLRILAVLVYGHVGLRVTLAKVLVVLIGELGLLGSIAVCSVVTSEVHFCSDVNDWCLFGFLIEKKSKVNLTNGMFESVHVLEYGLAKFLIAKFNCCVLLFFTFKNTIYILKEHKILYILIKKGQTLSF
ncbi:hypothetical protein BpHYR1_003684 [Brachionus plicatilis]|uniref:Uncharacterized protein n=1 Tax=Brachionus plicatilis TaxID=10195 RepID=A0A3M7RSE9_BRAPC|nr:hypothetical protein BpHYR1_003684 [Brachionus plicatilis]